jgi:hypothetical protein
MCCAHLRAVTLKYFSPLRAVLLDRHARPVTRLREPVVFATTFWRAAQRDLGLGLDVGDSAQRGARTLDVEQRPLYLRGMIGRASNAGQARFRERLARTLELHICGSNSASSGRSGAGGKGGDMGSAGIRGVGAQAALRSHSE